MLKFQAYSGKMRLLVYSSSESDSVKWKTRFAQVSSLFRKNETSRLLKFRVRFSETKISFQSPKRFCFIQTEALLYSNRAFVPPQQSLYFAQTKPLFYPNRASVLTLLSIRSPRTPASLPDNIHTPLFIRVLRPPHILPHCPTASTRRSFSSGVCAAIRKKRSSSPSKFDASRMSMPCSPARYSFKADAFPIRNRNNM